MSRAITIGRNPQSTIRISEDYDIVSNDHAEIIQQGVELTFTDHSSNGTIINGQKIKGKSVSIYRGDKIVLAGVYELPWSQIEAYIVPVGRPTVARNIRSEIRPEAGGAQDQTYSHTRPTDFFGDNRQNVIQDQRTKARVTESNDLRRTSLYDEGRADSSLNNSRLEKELSKWNWGAFYFGWIWGVFNKVYVSLVQLVVSLLSFAVTLMGMGIISPIFGLIGLGISIWLGVKGSRMAWDNGAYRNIEHLRTSRHNWNMAAAIVFGISVLLVIMMLLLFVDVITRIL